MDEPFDRDADVASIAVLDQPVRRSLYRALLDAGDWMGRDEAAAEVEIPRSVAAFHLDKLAAAGVVEVRYERLGDRRGPGAGRPSKLYRRASDEVAASVPDRHYDLAGSLLAAAIAESSESGVPVADCLEAVARRSGHDLGEAERDLVADGAAGDLVEVLARHGYEPEVGEGGEIVLANCPFHRLAEAQRELVCGMNRDFLGGVVDGLVPAGGVTALLRPTPGRCCVAIVED